VHGLASRVAMIAAQCCRSGWGSVPVSGERAAPVVGHHRRPDIGLEAVEPRATCSAPAIGALEARDASFDGSAEVAHSWPSRRRQAALLVEGN
jgi:hypothetical protein